MTPAQISAMVTGFNKRAPFRFDEAKIVVVARRGSHTYGTATKDSDEDFTIIVVPPIDFKLGYANPVHEKRWEGVQFVEEGVDCLFYSLDKFASLAAKCSPNAFELLWLRPEDLVVTTAAWHAVLRQRTLFASRRVYQTFLGMASSPDNMTEMHVVRLMRMLVEFLETNHLHVYRGFIDAEGLLDIKRARQSVTTEVTELKTRAETALQTSQLPALPDSDGINRLLINIHLDIYNLRYRRLNR